MQAANRAASYCTGVQGLSRGKTSVGVLPQCDQQRWLGQQVQKVHGTEQPAQGKSVPACLHWQPVYVAVYLLLTSIAIAPFMTPLSLS